ncbi:MAG: hypothetical protein WCK23_05535 [Actinomycetes bacterium]|jgi:hypothetical protein
MPKLQSVDRSITMFFWFVGTAVLSVWFVFRDPAFDHRTLVIGALLPDIIDGIWGGARAFHSVAVSVATLVVVMLATIGRRPIRKRLLAIPIGMFLHLIYDGAFNNTQVFWWPFTGLSFSGDRLPVVDRGILNIGFEVAGLLMCAFAWKKFNLSDATRRKNFVKSGTLSE